MENFRDTIGNVIVTASEPIAQILRDAHTAGKESWPLPLMLIGDSLGLYLGFAENDAGLSMFHDGRPRSIPTSAVQAGEVIGFTRVSLDKIADLATEYETGGYCGACDSPERILAQIPERLRTNKSPSQMPRVCFTCWTDERMNVIKFAQEDVLGSFPGVPNHQQDVFAEIATAAGMHPDTKISPDAWRPPGIEGPAPSLDMGMDAEARAHLFGESSSESSDDGGGES